MSTTLDTYFQLGESGLFVSPIALGAMSFGREWEWGADEGESLAIIDRYLDAGGNFIDTADIYTNGTSERVVGRALARGERRHRVVLATKGTLNFAVRDPNFGGNSRKALTQALDGSLARLGTDYVDLYFLHVHDGVTPVAETLRWADDAVRAGKVRYVGVSNYPVRKVVEWQLLARQHGATPLVAAQYEYSLLRRMIEVEHAPAFRELGIGQTPWGPLAAGVLTGRYSREDRTPSGARRAKSHVVRERLDPRAFDVLDALGEVAREVGTGHARVALAWLRSRPGVVAPIVGCRTPGHLEEAVASLAVEVPPALLDRLDRASAPDVPSLWASITPEKVAPDVRGGAGTVPWRR